MRAKWGSKIGFILATAGSAIGLGNIWRFPYLAGKYGGGVFLLSYLICVAGLGYFLLAAKLAFGRAAQTNIIDGFGALAEQSNTRISRFWRYGGGWLSFLNAVIVSSIYVIVIGWTASYVVAGGALCLGLSHQTIDIHLFSRLTSSFGQQLVWSFVCIGVTAFVIVKGIKQGIERVSLILMPVLFGLLLFMVIWMLFLPGSEQGIAFFLKPDWTRLGITPDGFQTGPFFDLILTALGQAIYSLSMGLGVAFVYGSYLSKQTDIKKSVGWIVCLDTLVAILSGLIVLPAVFAFGLDVGQGPALSFVSLPLIFAQMTAGRFFMFLFFVLLFLAAITSLISIYEAMVSLLMEKLQFSRIRSTIFVSGLNIVGTIVVLLSFTQVLPFKVLDRDLFDFFDYLTGTFTMTLMMLVCCIFMGWKVYPAIEKGLTGGGKHLSCWFGGYFKWLLRVIAPLAMLILLGSTLF